MNYLNYYIAILFLLCIPITSMGQNNKSIISGVVKDEQNKPIEFVNIALLEIPDSTFIKGVVTNSLGEFTMELPLESNHIKYLLSFSYLSYRTKNIPVGSQELRADIVLIPEAYSMSELTVTGRQQPYKLDGAKIKTQISESSLSSVGNAFDVMKYLPFLKVSGNNVNVFGKGKPLIFINKREVRSIVELSNLNSKRIKSITIDMAPGPEYLASVTSVIHIETLREEGVGMSGDINLNLHRVNNWGEEGNIYLSYVNKSITLYGDLSVNDARFKQKQQTNTYLIDKYFDTHEKAETDIKMHSSDYSSSIGFDYEIHKNHQLGAIYRFNNQWKGKGNAFSNSAFYDSQIKQDEYMNSIMTVGKNRKSYLNLFYSGKIHSWKLQFDTDYMSGKGSGGSESMVTCSNGNITNVNSLSENNSDFFASKLYIKKKIKRSNLLIGTQFTWTDSKYYYNNIESHEDLPSTFSHNKQLLYGLFGSFSTKLGYLQLNMGLRYEKVKFDYYLNDEYKKEQSLKDSYVFPTLLVSYPIQKHGINMSLSYRRTIVRPSYYSLRADIQYNSPHSYEAGNPSLKNVFVNDISYNFKIKNLMFLASYKMYENKIFFITKQFEDKPITLATFINSKDYKTLSFSLSYYYSLFNTWTPQIELSYQKPFLKHNFREKIIRYNRAEYSISLDNTISLPLDISLWASLSYSSPSDGGFTRTKNTFVTDLALQKKIKDRMSVRVGVQDIFNSNKDKWSMSYENVILNKSSYSNSRSFFISFSYSFNKVSYYQRSGANQKELNRL